MPRSGPKELGRPQASRGGLTILGHTPGSFGLDKISFVPTMFSKLIKEGSMAKRKKKKKAQVRKPVPTPKPVKPAERQVTQKVDFRKEYPYVYSDLKRAGLTALAMLAFMLILSIIVR